MADVDASPDVQPDAASDAAPEEQETAGAFTRARRRVFRAPKHPWLAAAGVLVVVLLLFEVYVRVIENQFETLRAGDSAEMILKAERIVELSNTDRHVGAVFLGNSMMDTAISPGTFLGNSKTYKSAYNASVVGAPLQTRKRWADEIVLANLDPDVIVLGVHPVDLLHTDFLKINQDPEQADVIFGRVLRETNTSPVGAAERAVNDNIAIVRDRGILRRPRTLWDATVREVKGEPKPKEFDVRTIEDWQAMLSPNGEISLFHKQPFKQESIKNQGPKLAENLQTANFSTVELNSLLDFLASTGKKVVLVIPPVPLDAWNAAGVNMDALHQGNKIISDAAASRHFAVLDYTDRGYKNGLFGDVLHANDLGSLQFSKQLAADLDQLR